MQAGRKHEINSGGKEESERAKEGRDRAQGRTIRKTKG